MFTSCGVFTFSKLGNMLQNIYADEIAIRPIGLLITVNSLHKLTVVRSMTILYNTDTLNSGVSWVTVHDSI